MEFLELFSVVLGGSLACLVGSVLAPLTGHGLLEVGPSGHWSLVGSVTLICFCLFEFVLRFIHLHAKKIGPAFTSLLGSIMDIIHLRFGGTVVRYMFHVAFHLVWKVTLNSEEPGSVLVFCISILALLSLWAIYARKADVPSFISIVNRQLGLTFGEYMVTGKVLCGVFVLIPWFLTFVIVQIGLDKLGELYVVAAVDADDPPKKKI